MKNIRQPLKADEEQMELTTKEEEKLQDITNDDNGEVEKEELNH